MVKHSSWCLCDATAGCRNVRKLQRFILPFLTILSHAHHGKITSDAVSETGLRIPVLMSIPGWVCRPKLSSMPMSF